jgi:hypothetical protein
MNLSLLLVLVLGMSAVDACSRRRPPPPPPPPEAPPAPQAPPPIVKVVRTQEQNVGFNKCLRKCAGQNTQVNESGVPIGEATAFGVQCNPSRTAPSTYGSGPKTEDATTPPVTYTTPDGKPCAMSTDCVYECKFTVYSEVALRTISKPTECGCAFHINIVKPRPNTRVVANTKYTQQAQSVTIGDFQLVVWDYMANRVVEKVEGFTLLRNQQTKNAIAAQVQAGMTSDFTSLTAGFAGEVTRFEALPKSLNLNFKENEFHVPALQFEVTQTYTDTKTWEPPAKPDLEKMPNAWQSQCVPYWKDKPYCYNDKKRQINKACGSTPNQVWMKKFFLFPKESQLSQTQGKTYAARMITSFYKAADCRVKNGFFSVDSEFTQQLEETDGGLNLAIGTWAWKRVFIDEESGAKFGTSYVLGVPSVFSSIQEVWDKGYSTISWFAPNGFDGQHELVSQVCSQFTPAGPATTNSKYGETHRAFSGVQAGIKCAPHDDAVKNNNCGRQNTPDRSLMAFINEGQILNFNKNEDSILVIGKTTAGCQSAPIAEALFDVLQFHGVIAGQEPITRNEKRELTDDIHSLGLVYDEEHNAFRHFLHPGAHEMLFAQRRKRAIDVLDALTSSVATPPNEADFDMRVATGSVDKNGGNNADAGDHPIELFPETFSAPVNIDPKANAAVVVDASSTTGSRPPPCNKGSIGCGCRTTGANPCDMGLLCASNNKCMMKECKPGQQGCPCDGANGCQAGLACLGQVCALKSTCTVGKAGCECDATAACSDASTCTDGICLLKGSCASGSAGCTCSADPVAIEQKAKDGELFCAAGLECDRFMGACLAPRCKSGEPGCRCKGDKSCEGGFQCDTSVNVCATFQCPVGDPGCQCLTGNKCNKVAFKCEPFTTAGDNRCVSTGDSCADDGLTATQRCVNACGAGNILRCPPCQNGKIVCKEESAAKLCQLPENKDRKYCQVCLKDPFNPICSAAPTNVVSAVLAAAIVIVVALF